MNLEFAFISVRCFAWRSVGSLALAVLIAPAGWASAGECEIALSEPDIDLGLAERSGLRSARDQSPLSERTVSLTVNCDQPSEMILEYRAPSSDGSKFDLGTNPIAGAGYSVTVHEAVLDGGPATLAASDATATFAVSSAQAVLWRPGERLSPVSAGTPLRGQTFSAKLTVAAFAPDQMLRVREATTWRSEGVFLVGTAGAASLSVSLRADPGSCMVSLANNGLVDFQHIPAESLNQTAPTALPLKSIELNVNCAASSLFAIRVQENREGTANVDSDIAFGLGHDARSAPIGHYSLRLDPSQSIVDSKSAVYQTEGSSGVGGSWTPASSGATRLSKASLHGFTDVSGGSSGPTSIQNLTSTLTVEAEISPRDVLDLSTEIQLDGLATIELEYL